MPDKILTQITFFSDHGYYPNFVDITRILWIFTFRDYYPYFVDVSSFSGYYPHLVDIVDISVFSGYYIYWSHYQLRIS